MSDLAQRLRDEAVNVDNSNTWDTWAVDSRLLRDVADVLDALIHRVKVAEERAKIAHEQSAEELEILRNLVMFAEELCETKADYESPELTAARAALSGEPTLITDGSLSK